MNVEIAAACFMLYTVASQQPDLPLQVRAVADTAATHIVEQVLETGVEAEFEQNLKTIVAATKGHPGALDLLAEALGPKCQVLGGLGEEN